MSEKTRLEVVTTMVQVLGVVIGIVISILSFNSAREKEAQARISEAEKPLQELRRAVYVETVKAAAVIATPAARSEEELDKAKRKFRELYVAELSMVELPGVEAAMVNFARVVDPQLLALTESQRAALNLSHALRDSYVSVPDKVAKK